MPIEIPTPGRVQAAKPTLGNAPDAPRSFFAGRGIDVPLDRTRATPGAFSGDGGLEAVNQSLQGILGRYNDHLQKVQQIKNTGDIIEKEDEGRFLITKLATEIQTDASISPDRWFDELKRRAPDIEAQLLSGDLPPAVQRRVKANFSQSYGTMLVKMFEKGTTETLTRARDTGLHVADKYADEENLPAAQEVVGGLVDTGALDPDSGRRVIDGLSAKVQVSRANRMLSTDPQWVLDNLPAKDDEVEGSAFSNVSKHVRHQYEQKAREAIGKRNSLALGEMVERLESGDPTIMPTPAEIEGIDWMDKRAKKNFIESYYDKNPRKQDIEEVNQIRTAIAAYDPEKDPFSERINAINAAIYSSTGEFGRKELGALLNERMDSLKRAESEPKTDMLRRIDLLHKLNIIGEPLPEDTSSPEYKTTKYENEVTKDRIARKFVEEWERNGKPGFAESSKLLDSITNPNAVASAIRMLNPAGQIRSAPSRAQFVTPPTEPVDPALSPLPLIQNDDNPLFPSLTDE